MYEFFQDIYKGLTAPVKYLQSKYFYDAEGDRLFQQIMQSPEYYLTRCELEILSQQSPAIADKVLQHLQAFDVVELGAGDAMKSSYFLAELLKRDISFTYYPVDISQHVISLLHKELPQKLPGLSIQGLQGEYFDMLQQANYLSKKNKLVLFLGSNIGNFSPEEALQFCRSLREFLAPGDMFLVGIDLKKNPQLILDAYHDKAGITKAFNLNLLKRINRELDADFDTSRFDHFPIYDPVTGACKSYLISQRHQVVRIGEADFITFKKDEPILMEVSQKYSLEQVYQLAQQSGFSIVHNYFDPGKWFVDSLWTTNGK